MNIVNFFLDLSQTSFNQINLNRFLNIVIISE